MPLALATNCWDEVVAIGGETTEVRQEVFGLTSSTLGKLAHPASNLVLQLVAELSEGSTPPRHPRPR